MKCPHCGQIHSDEIIDCPTTEKKLKRACTNPLCSYYGEYLFPLEQDTCPCCGNSLVDTHNGHKFVDLGLSVKWATCNVGAVKPEDFGGYYQWAGTKDVSNTSFRLDWSNCPYNVGNDKYEGWTKYDVNNTRVLECCDDPSHVNWGGRWRMPTKEEWKELYGNCNWKWITENGVNGYKVTSKNNDTSIFLPAAGFRRYNDLISIGLCGAYWSSTPNFLVGPFLARFASFGQDDVYTDELADRCSGFSVRAVVEF